MKFTNDYEITNRVNFGAAEESGRFFKLFKKSSSKPNKTEEQPSCSSSNWDGNFGVIVRGHFEIDASVEEYKEMFETLHGDSEFSWSLLKKSMSDLFAGLKSGVKSVMKSINDGKDEIKQFITNCREIQVAIDESGITADIEIRQFRDIMEKSAKDKQQ